MSDPALSLPALQPEEIVAQPLPSRPDNAEAAKQFEAMLMAYVFQQMRQTVPVSGLFGDDGIARSTYDYLLDQAVATKALAAGKGWGLAQRLEASWKTRPAKIKQQ